MQIIPKLVEPTGTLPPRFLPDFSPIYQLCWSMLRYHLNLFLWIQFSSKSTFADFLHFGAGRFFSGWLNVL